MSLFDTRYAQDGYYYGTEPNDFLRGRHSAIPAGGRVLCLAEGEGRNAVFLAQQGYSVSAVDLSPAGIVKTQALAAQRGVSVDAHCANLATHDLGEAQWDGIVAIFCHLPPNLRTKVLAGVVRGLRPGGVFVLEAYRPDQVGRGTGGPPDPTLCVPRLALEDALGALDTLWLHEVDRPVIEGKGHTGVGAVVQYLGRKPRLQPI